MCSCERHWLPLARCTCDCSESRHAQEHCRNCHQQVVMIIYRGTGWCSQYCQRGITEAAA